MADIEIIIQRREDMAQGPLSEYDPEAYSLLVGAFGFMRGLHGQHGEHSLRMPSTDIRTAGGLLLGYTVNGDGRDRVFVHHPGTVGLAREWSSTDVGELVTSRRLYAADGTLHDIDNHPVMLLTSTDINGQDLPSRYEVGVSIEETAIDGLYVYTAGQLPDQPRFDPYDHLPPGALHLPVPMPQ
ncbi:MAG TPA: hypothetical protein VF466_03560 [Candidatus Saccharimonadales bacterium]